MNYEAKQTASIDDWKNDIRASLTRTWDGSDDRALSMGVRFLVGKRGYWPLGDRALDQMKRSGELVHAGGGGKNSRWALASEDQIASDRQAAKREQAEIARLEKRDRALLAQLADAGVPANEQILDALRVAYEAGRESTGRRR